MIATVIGACFSPGTAETRRARPLWLDDFQEPCWPAPRLPFRPLTRGLSSLAKQGMMRRLYLWNNHVFN
jgi:hypothetical protein